jgi:hypothetical protein
VPLTVLTGVDPSWVFARVNVLVSSLVSRLAAVLSLVYFGAQDVGFVNLGFLDLDRSDRRDTPA